MAGSGGSGGFQVSATELQNHVRAVRQAAATVGQAMAAAQQVTMGVEAYGLICGPLFVPIVTAVSAPALITLKVAEDSLNSVADTLGKTAAAYASADQGNANSFSTLDGGAR